MSDAAPRQRDLPVPGLDMEGEDAADFIDQIAELYSGTDRWHVRRLAAHLRKPPDEPAEPPLTLTDLEGLSSEVDSATCDARSAVSALEDASYEIDKAIKALKSARST